ncbi:MAG: hypothetical protein HYX66_02330 [Ignavibacteria bacterium]|nr:hypothetical protein [Ignavibacteria bacterium]
MSKRRRWFRWLFAIVVVVSFIFLVYVINRFLTEAQMSMGPTPISGNDVDALLINKKDYSPPGDGLLRIAQVHVCLRIWEALDSLTSRGSSANTIRRNVTELLNSHLQTRASYTWARNTIVTALIRPPKTPSDSMNVELIRMMRPRLENVRHVPMNSLDAELLVTK